MTARSSCTRASSAPTGGGWAWWGDRVAAPWERAVASSLDSIQTEAERRLIQPGEA